jgi:glycosyltransferase involved in cell wall biosynthesis
MKIVQVVPRYPPRTGGVETHVKEVSERLVEGYHDVTVLTADDGRDVTTKENRNGVEVIRHAGFAPSDALHVAPGILRTLRRYDADVVHTHNYHSLPVLFAAIGAGDARFVVTPHYHSGSASSFRNRLLSLYCPVGRWALRRADDVVAVSDWEREQLRDDFGIDTTVIPNGIDVERFRGAEPREEEQPYLLTVGRLREYKGIQHVIRALPDLPEYDLLVAGSGPYRKELEQIAIQQGVEDRVRFLGYVDDDDLPSLYAGADAYVTMSNFESFGITVGEALAAGTPVVVRDGGALSEWAKRDDCSIAPPHGLEDTVRDIVGKEPSQETLPRWSDLVDSLLDCY